VEGFYNDSLRKCKILQLGGTAVAVADFTVSWLEITTSPARNISHFDSVIGVMWTCE